MTWRGQATCESFALRSALACCKCISSVDGGESLLEIFPVLSLFARTAEGRASEWIILEVLSEIGMMVVFCGSAIFRPGSWLTCMKTPPTEVLLQPVHASDSQHLEYERTHMIHLHNAIDQGEEFSAMTVRGSHYALTL